MNIGSSNDKMKVSGGESIEIYEQQRCCYVTVQLVSGAGSPLNLRLAPLVAVFSALMFSRKPSVGHLFEPGDLATSLQCIYNHFFSSQSSESLGSCSELLVLFCL